MKIYSMTATFGKLTHETLELKPGLNVIQAPNEWGKSTWCAFLAAMLYGLDTRAKSTKSALAEKDRYAPWSGVPMEGRMEIRWNGRDITVERSSKGRIPMGTFRAYETRTGVEVPELDARNCGQMLLGVEKSVFLRSGFIRFTDMPVSQDDALRARLNALVTTGDESGAGEQLAKKLKELKNRCRYHKTGLLPQAEAERDRLEGQLAELEGLKIQCENLQLRQAENRDWIRKLENHQAALAYRAAVLDAQRLDQARMQQAEAAARAVQQEENCEDLAKPEQLQAMLKTAAYLESEAATLAEESRMLQEDPKPVQAPGFALGMEGEAALAQAQADGKTYAALKRCHPVMVLLMVLAVIGAAAAVRYGLPYEWIGAVVAVILGIVLGWGWMRRRKAGKIASRYGSKIPACWIAEAKQYAQGSLRYAEQCRLLASRRDALAQRWTAHEEKLRKVTGGEDLVKFRETCEAGLGCWETLAEARREQERASRYLETVEAMVRPMPPEPAPDDLTLAPEETAWALQKSRENQARLLGLESQYRGRMEALGDSAGLEKQLDAVRARIRKLEETYRALTLAQETLAQATTELQRRFAPRITQGARKRMEILTDGRYDRLQLGEDLSLQAGAAGEDILRDAIWRSDGTADQLYLALRLAVAEALMPGGPLVLDDALVRFDDTRLAAALKLLQAEAKTRQVILFTCQSREQNLLM